MAVSTALEKYVTRPAGWFGAEPKGFARSIGNFLLTVGFDTIYDLLFTRFGAKFFKGISALITVVAAKASKSVDVSTDLIDLSTRFLRGMLDGRPEDWSEVIGYAKEFGRALGKLDTRTAAKYLVQSSEEISKKLRSLSESLKGLAPKPAAAPTPPPPPPPKAPPAERIIRYG